MCPWVCLRSVIFRVAGEGAPLVLLFLVSCILYLVSGVSAVAAGCNVITAAMRMVHVTVQAGDSLGPSEHRGPLRQPLSA